MDNPNGVNSFPYGLTTLPIGITTTMTGFPQALDSLISDDEGARHYLDNMDESKKAEVLRNVKDFQSQEELERYLYHLENDEFK